MVTVLTFLHHLHSRTTGPWLSRYVCTTSELEFSPITMEARDNQQSANERLEYDGDWPGSRCAAGGCEGKVEPVLSAPPPDDWSHRNRVCVLDSGTRLQDGRTCWESTAASSRALQQIMFPQNPTAVPLNTSTCQTLTSAFTKHAHHSEILTWMCPNPN